MKLSFVEVIDLVFSSTEDWLKISIWDSNLDLVSARLMWDWTSYIDGKPTTHFPAIGGGPDVTGGSIRLAAWGGAWEGMPVIFAEGG